MFSIDPNNPTIVLKDNEVFTDTGIQGNGDDGGIEINSKRAEWIVEMGNIFQKKKSID